MKFVKDLNFLHVDVKEIPCFTQAGAPSERTAGDVGVLYMDTDTGNLYKCTAADFVDNLFTWKLIGDADPAQVQQAVADYMTQNPVSSAGLSADAIDLLITILQNTVFTSNQTGNIAALAEALTAGSSSGDSGSGDSGDSGGSGGDSGSDGTGEEETPTDDITVSDGIMSIVTVGSEITVFDGIMTIA